MLGRFFIIGARLCHYPFSNTFAAGIQVIDTSRLAAMAKQGDMVLICWCKQPGFHDVPCHGDILKSAVMWMNSANTDPSTDAENPDSIPE
jgi:hypothetical protein